MRKLRRKIKVVTPPESKKQYYFNIVITILTAISLGVAIFSLFTTQKQLKVASSSYKGEVYSRRPLISREKIINSDFDKNVNGVITPVITIEVKNVGLRDAMELKINRFIIPHDFTFFWSDIATNNTEQLSPNETLFSSCYPEILQRNIENFYFCFEFLYHDAPLDTTFSQQFYYQFGSINQKTVFFRCKKPIKENLRNYINDHLLSEGYDTLAPH